MVIIGLALFVVAGAFGVDLASNNRFPTRNIHVFGESLGVSGSAHLYVIGAITGAALVVGIGLLLAGLQRKGSKATQHHREHKMIDSHESELERLRAENSDLRRRLDASERPDHDNIDSGATDREPASGGSTSSL